VRVIVLSCLAALALSYGAALVLRAEQEPAYQAFSTSGARVGDPGENLVGPGWWGTDQGRGAPHT
jgi:hypothetical protein